MKKSTLFMVGGTGYVGLELLWRGRSHVSMFAAGGVCLLLLDLLARKVRYAPARALAGAGIVTAVELVTGLLVNRDHSVWDYRAQPVNFLGQICLCYSLLWIPVSLGATALCDLLKQRGHKDGIL